MYLRKALLIFPLICAATAAAAQEEGLITTGSGGYTMRPGDVLRIEVWGRQELTGRFQVDELGNVNYPMLGAISTVGINVAELRDTLRTGLENLFADPFVTITPLFRLAVLGKVRDPGLYTVDPTLTVLDLVALAGGPSADGNMNGTRLLRGGEEIRVNLRRQSLRGQTLQEMGVRSGDQIIVPRKAITAGDLSLFVAVAQLGLSLAILLRQ
ncbi:MAG: polysaccharide export protein [Gemmatimonadetes bacterium]|nr:polysaccharide export protein [Gemmatimonadota bacterium]